MRNDSVTNTNSGIQIDTTNTAEQSCGVSKNSTHITPSSSRNYKISMSSKGAKSITSRVIQNANSVAVNAQAVINDKNSIGFFDVFKSLENLKKYISKIFSSKNENELANFSKSIQNLSSAIDTNSKDEIKKAFSSFEKQLMTISKNSELLATPAGSNHEFEDFNLLGTAQTPMQAINNQIDILKFMVGEKSINSLELSIVDLSTLSKDEQVAFFNKYADDLKTEYDKTTFGGRHYDINQQKELIQNKLSSSKLDTEIRDSIFQKVDDIDRKYRDAQKIIEESK